MKNRSPACFAAAPATAGKLARRACAKLTPAGYAVAFRRRGLRGAPKRGDRQWQGRARRLAKES
jgi:hypothetical protein